MTALKDLITTLQAFDNLKGFNRIQLTLGDKHLIVVCHLDETNKSSATYIDSGTLYDHYYMSNLIKSIPVKYGKLYEDFRKEELMKELESI